MKERKTGERKENLEIMEVRHSLGKLRVEPWSSRFNRRLMILGYGSWSFGHGG